MNDEVLYLESDEEITAAIDKLLATPATKVSLVVPKRSTLLQSIVNQRLLKKAANDAGKELVLVTTDRTASHLAGQVGLAVAATLKADAAVPTAPAAGADLASEVIEESDPPPPPDPEPAPTAAAKPKNAKPSYAKPMMVRNAVGSGLPAAINKMKVPNFNALQKRLLWVALAGGLVLLLVFGNFFLKSAKVTLFAKGSELPADFAFTVDPAVKDSDPGRALLAGQTLQLTKDLTSTFTATGKKDAGTPAHGTMTVSNCGDNQSHTFVAGTRFQSNGKVFKSDSDVTVPGGSIFFGACSPGKASVSVTSEAAGDTYNLGPARYTIPALPANQQPYIYGDGEQMSGGTTKQITVVTQADVDKAKSDLLSQNKDEALKGLSDKLPAGYQLLNESFDQTVGTATSSPAVDSEASQASLSLNVTYSALSVSKADFSKLVTAQELKQIGDANQIYDDGTASATITADKKDSAGRQAFHFASTAFAGAKIDTKALAKQLAGKHYGDAVDLAGRQPGVDRVTIDLWPGFASKLPHLTSKIIIIIKVSGRS